MKKILILVLLPLFLCAQTYTISGGQGNIVMHIASEIIKKAYKRADIDINIIFLPLEESLQSSNSGITDAEISRVKEISETYTNLVIVPVELIEVEAIAFSKNTKLKIKNWSDLKGHKLTIVKGTKFIEESTKNLEKESLISFKEAFMALNNGQTEIVVVPKLSGLKIIYDNGYKDIEIVSQPLQSMKLYHFVNNKNAHIIPVLTPILQSMKDSGEISYMRASYLRSITR